MDTVDSLLGKLFDSLSTAGTALQLGDTLAAQAALDVHRIQVEALTKRLAARLDELGHVPLPDGHQPVYDGTGPIKTAGTHPAMGPDADVHDLRTRHGGH